MEKQDLQLIQTAATSCVDNIDHFTFTALSILCFFFQQQAAENMLLTVKDYTTGMLCYGSYFPLFLPI